MPMITQLHVVLASPDDVRKERAVVPEVLNELNEVIAAERGLHLQLRSWERDAYPGFDTKGPQGLIDAVLKIRQCDIFIAVFWKRYGTPTAQAASGTVQECQEAFESWQETGKPHIMVYFCNRNLGRPRSREEREQTGRVLSFQQTFPQFGLWWEYRTPAEFERLLRRHLSLLLRSKYPLSGAIANGVDGTGAEQPSLSPSE